MVDKYYVNICEKRDPPRVEESMGPMGRRQAERVENGVNINLDHGGFYTVIALSAEATDDEMTG